MNITGICPYETPCGWCYKWDKKCNQKIECGSWLTSEVEENITKILAMFQMDQYVCSICGKIISPKVEFDKDGQINMTVDKAELRGGLGHKTIRNNICSECANNSGIY